MDINKIKKACREVVMFTRDLTDDERCCVLALCQAGAQAATTVTTFKEMGLIK